MIQVEIYIQVSEISFSGGCLWDLFLIFQNSASLWLCPLAGQAYETWSISFLTPELIFGQICAQLIGQWTHRTQFCSLLSKKRSLFAVSGSFFEATVGSPTYSLAYPVSKDLSAIELNFCLTLSAEPLLPQCPLKFPVLHPSPDCWPIRWKVACCIWCCMLLFMGAKISLVFQIPIHNYYIFKLNFY